MKKAIFIAFGIIYLFGFPFSVQAQYYEGVLEVYYQSVAYPESFDEYVAINSSKFDSQFFSCLDALEIYWRDQARQEEEICNSHVDPEWRRQCLNEAIFINLPAYCVSLRSVLAGNLRWTDTIQGQAFILGKNIAGSELWIQSLNTTLQIETVRLIYLCQ